MRAWWAWVGAVTVVVAAATLRADDAVRAPSDAPAPQRQAVPPGIDLAAHVDINVVLPANQWRVAGGMRNVVIAGGGRLVIEGNLTIGGEPIAATAERVRRTDEVLLGRLKRAQAQRLAAVAADPLVPADRRRALELATEIDIRDALTRVARLRMRYEGRRANLGDEDWQAFQKDVQLCRRSLAEPFGDDSLFAAVRAGIEAPDTGR